MFTLYILKVRFYANFSTVSLSSSWLIHTGLGIPIRSSGHNIPHLRCAICSVPVHSIQCSRWNLVHAYDEDGPDPAHRDHLAISSARVWDDRARSRELSSTSG
ncbi:hypothetical protein QCA50_011372 [Cerrena zonata]|uniref:Secreted protein n=1 Tax=Cerrena zonata TaxID=2478898 RepID=A0AAW0FZG8_9APHY